MEFVSKLNAWVGNQLSDAAGPEALALLFVGGLLASLLPCVYPLYPVTAAVLKSRSSGNPWSHPIAYYAGLSGAYLSFGILAAITGGTFNQLLRLPIINLAIGVTLLLLALATVGLLDFPTPNRAGPGRNGLAGTLVMGGAAGLLSSACVGPIVVSILLGIATNTDGVTAHSALAAATKMFAFGLGVGAPVVAIGALGMALPKAGRWMLLVQWVFGALILTFAGSYARKGLMGYGFESNVAESILIGAALMLGASYFLDADRRDSAERTKRSLLLVAGVVGFFVLGRQLLTVPGRAPATSVSSLQSASLNLTETKGNLTWYLDERSAYEAAARAGKPVFVDFHGDWCTNCNAFQANTQSDPELNQALQDAVLLKIYDTSPLFEKYRSDPRFPELKVGLPFFSITDAKGNVLYKTSDYTKTDEMVLFLSG